MSAKLIPDDDPIPGQIKSCLELLKPYKVDTSTAERECRNIRQLSREMAALPGGSSVPAGAISGLRFAISEMEARLAGRISAGMKGRFIDEPRLAIGRLKGELEAKLAHLATLPEEAQLDLNAGVARAEEELTRLRAANDLENIRKVAETIPGLRARALVAAADRDRLQRAINASVAAAQRGAAASLLAAFKVVVGKVRRLTSDTAFQSAPELIDIKAVEACWREAQKILEAFSMLGAGATPPQPTELLEAVPEPLKWFVGTSLGLPMWAILAPRPPSAMVF